MEKSEIAIQAKKIDSVKKLAKLLCDIKTDEFGTDAHPITEKQLLHFCNPKIVGKRYKTFSIPKKRGGVREISSPNYQLGCILHILNIMLKAIYNPRQSTMGFVEGKSVAHNADIHKGHHYVLNIDLSDFFPSIRQARVWKCLQLKPFCFNEKVASVIAGLCCNQKSDNLDSVLPQGAATSPLLSNIVCEKLDRRLEGVARRFGMHYTRYADDMTFSSMHNVYQPDGEFMSELRRIIRDQGFILNEAKTRLQKNGSRQEVTGLTVNEKVNVTKKYIRQLRFFLFKWQTEGYAKAYALFYGIYKHEKGYIKKGEPVMENVIGGKLDYLKMVKGEHDSTYITLRNWYDRLQQIVYIDTETDKKNQYVYVQPYTVPEFEELFRTTITLLVSKKGKLCAKCTMFGKEKTINISNNSQLQICPNLTSAYAVGDVVHSEVLKDCYVTLCQKPGKQVKNFWLITRNAPKRSKCLSLQNIRIDNNIIDAILKIWESEGIESAVTAFNDIINGASPMQPLQDSAADSEKDVSFKKKFNLKSQKTGKGNRERPQVSDSESPTDSELEDIFEHLDKLDIDNPDYIEYIDF